MRHPNFRHIAAAGAITLIATVPLTACGNDPSVSARPAQAAENETLAPGLTPTAAPSASIQARDSEPGVARQPAGRGPAKTGPAKPTSTRPTSAKPTSTKPPGTCYGAVRHDLDLRNTVLDLVKSMCFHTGGVLRLQGIGPGLVTASPGSLVSSSYEGGVVDLRFIRPGTVTVTIPQDEQTYTITVVVVG
jgi:hypothetical protein